MEPSGGEKEWKNRTEAINSDTETAFRYDWKNCTG